MALLITDHPTLAFKCKQNCWCVKTLYPSWHQNQEKRSAMWHHLYAKRRGFPSESARSLSAVRRTLTLQSSALCIHTAAQFWDRLVTVLSCPPTLPLRAAISHARLFLTRMQTPWRLRWKPCSLGDKAEGHL